MRFKCHRKKMTNVTKSNYKTNKLRAEFACEASVAEGSESCLVKHQTDDWLETDTDELNGE